MTRAPASAAPMAAPNPAGPPPTTSTSVSPATPAARNARLVEVVPTPASSPLSSCSDASVFGRRARGEQFDGDAVGFERSLLQRRKRLGDMRTQRILAVPAFVEIRD